MNKETEQFKKTGFRWSTPVDGKIHVPDELDKLVNKMMFQYGFHEHSGLFGPEEMVCRMAEIAQDYFKGQSTQQPQESAGEHLIRKALLDLLNYIDITDSSIKNSSLFKDTDDLLRLISPSTQQPQESAGVWVTENPVFTEDCILLTACLIREEWEYQCWQIEKLFMDGNWYWGWLNMDGEEYGDIADLAADKYKVIKLLK